MADLRAHAEPISMMDVDDEHSMFNNYNLDFNNSFKQGIDNLEHEPFSQPWVNYPTAIFSSEEYSQAPTKFPVAFSPQPSPEFLESLGIKVRDFAYENTLPAIVPVPRVPRQVQPDPQTLKRSQRDWDEEREDLWHPQSILGKSPPKKSRSLERKPTEPLEEAGTCSNRALGRYGGYPIRLTMPIPKTPSPPTPRRPASTGPPLTPSLSHIASQDSELVKTPSTFPFVVHVHDMLPPKQLDPALQAASIHPVLLTSFPSDPNSAHILSSPRHSPLRLPRDVSPSHIIDPLLGPPLPMKESGRNRSADGTSRMTPPTIRYQLRQRPIVSSHTTTISSRRSRPQSRTSKSLPRRR